MNKSLLLVIPLIGSAPSALMAETPSFYMGFDQQIRDLRFSGGAEHLFNTKDMPQRNFFVGFMLTPSLSIEVGSFRSHEMYEYETLRQGDTYFGGVFGFASQRLNTNSVSLDTVDRIDTNNTARIRGFTVGLRETLPVGGGFSLNATASVSRITMRLSHTIVRYYTADEIGTPNQNNQLDFLSTRMVPSIGIGVDYAMLSNLQLRVNVLWEQTSKFNNITPEQTTVRPGKSIVDAKNSKVYSIGVIWQF